MLFQFFALLTVILQFKEKWYMISKNIWTYIFYLVFGYFKNITLSFETKTSFTWFLFYRQPGAKNWYFLRFRKTRETVFRIFNSFSHVISSKNRPGDSAKTSRLGKFVLFRKRIVKYSVRNQCCQASWLKFPVFYFPVIFSESIVKEKNTWCFLCYWLSNFIFLLLVFVYCCEYVIIIIIILVDVRNHILLLKKHFQHFSKELMRFYRRSRYFYRHLF